MFYLLNTITKPKYMRTIGTSLDFRCTENCPFTIFTIDTSSLSTTTSCCYAIFFDWAIKIIVAMCPLFTTSDLVSHHPCMVQLKSKSYQTTKKIFSFSYYQYIFVCREFRESILCLLYISFGYKIFVYMAAIILQQKIILVHKTHFYISVKIYSTIHRWNCYN